MGPHTTTSERIDELPLLIYWLKQMKVEALIDQVLGPPHGNWEGLSYGEVALGSSPTSSWRAGTFSARSKTGPSNTSSV